MVLSVGTGTVVYAIAQVGKAHHLDCANTVGLAVRLGTKASPIDHQLRAGIGIIFSRKPVKRSSQSIVFFRQKREHLAARWSDSNSAPYSFTRKPDLVTTPCMRCSRHGRE